MTDLIFLVIILAQWGVLVLMEKKHQEKENKLINAILAKTPQQMVDLTVADKFRPEAEPKLPEDWVAENQLTDEEFNKLVIKGGA